MNNHIDVRFKHKQKTELRFYSSKGCCPLTFLNTSLFLAQAVGSCHNSIYLFPH